MLDKLFELYGQETVSNDPNIVRNYSLKKRTDKICKEILNLFIIF